MSIDIEQIIREYIDKTVHMSLATVRDNKPWVCEVHFGYDDELNLYWISKTSRRHSQEIAANPYVAGTIVQQYQRSEPCGGALYFEGTASLLETEAERRTALQALSKNTDVTEQDVENAKDPSNHQFYKVSVDDWAVFGSFDDQPAQKYELKWGSK